MVLYSLNDVIREITLCKANGFDKKEFQEWLFEYACRTCEYESILPTSRPDYINLLMIQKAHDIKQYIVFMYQSMHTNPKKELQFNLPSYSSIDKIVHNEHIK